MITHIRIKRASLEHIIECTKNTGLLFNDKPYRVNLIVGKTYVIHKASPLRVSVLAEDGKVRSYSREYFAESGQAKVQLKDFKWILLMDF